MDTRFEIDERDRIVFKNYETGESFSVRLRTPYSAGTNAYLSLVSAAKGHYICDEFVTNYSMPKPCPEQLGRTAVSKDDIFEVKSGVINYVGDWDATDFLRWGRSAEFPEIDVTYDMASIEKARAHFSAQMGKYEVFISYKGKQAISLNDLAKLLKQH
jgi:hypothetical protein